ncbi:unnamed protein product [Pleuronectes platessa]|uniref:Uncharacterized protein n=1 Tax=Pleuronectes platessa TaxID=8262 RepID=A0A9N7Z0M5_PLEPL|nr:unnamed protein product [Pleuronectes platessa]
MSPSPKTSRGLAYSTGYKSHLLRVCGWDTGRTPSPSAMNAITASVKHNRPKPLTTAAVRRDSIDKGRQNRGIKHQVLALGVLSVCPACVPFVPIRVPWRLTLYIDTSEALASAFNGGEACFIVQQCK